MRVQYSTKAAERDPTVEPVERREDPLVEPAGAFDGGLVPERRHHPLHEAERF